MSKRTIRLLAVLSVLLALAGAGLIVAGIVGSPWTPATHATSFASLPLFVIGVVIAALALVLHQIAWAGALINLARLQHWGWFGFVLAFHGLAVLVYLIAGPTTPAAMSHAALNVQHSEQLLQNSLRS